MSIEIQNIHKSFGGFCALKDVNLKFDTGSLTALLGPSGSGKTSLLRIIAGLEVPDLTETPRVIFGDRDTLNQPVANRQVGFVFQHYALFRHLSVFENIAFGLRVKPRTERLTEVGIKEKVNSLLRLIQLESVAGRYPNQLSGGQRQRVALARALAIEPAVLLLDEPFGALDAKVRTELRRWLRRLHDQLHVTSVFVTHDQEEALEVADQVVVMNQGQVEQVGTPDEVFHHPASEFVMQFIGNVNVFHGRGEEPLPGGDEDYERFLVRPHDLEVLTDAEPKKWRFNLPARVHRILTAGAQVKVELLDGQNRTLLAELTHERFAELGLRLHQEVFLAPRSARFY